MANARSRVKQAKSLKKERRVAKRDLKHKKGSRTARSNKEMRAAKQLIKVTNIESLKHRTRSRSKSDDLAIGVKRAAKATKKNLKQTIEKSAKRISNGRCRPLKDNFTDILAKELTKKPTKMYDAPLDGASKEPQIITMKLKSPPDSPEATPGPSHNRQKLSRLSASGDPLECRSWDTFILPVRIEEHKPDKIEDMNVLRQMLKLPKIQLSNGVEISVPPSPHQTYKCDHCGRAFRNKQDLRKHVLIHLDLRPHGCPRCARRFRQRGNLKSHMARMHAAALPAPPTFVCDKCGARFYSKEGITKHLIKHEAKTFSCRHCSRTFPRNTMLHSHLRTEHGLSRFYCYMCPASFASQRALELHLSGQHLAGRRLVCEICGKAFARHDLVDKHVRTTHRGEKRFQCPVCSKWLKGHLADHVRTHVQIKPYACVECGRRFTQASQLAVHKRSHTGVKPYVCRVCNRPFSHSNALNLHTRIHTGEKPFGCAMCPLAFSQLPHMKAHMRAIHNKPEAYKCGHCGQFFKLRAALEEHRRECAPWHLDRAPNHASDEPGHVVPAMSLSKMRFLLAVLLQTIADKHRLRVLGFNKRLIDDLLVDSLEATGHAPLRDTSLPPAARLKHNIQLLLEWTVPPHVMHRFRLENKSTEQLLEELAG